MPRDYSATRRQLIGLLREFDQNATIDFRQVDVLPFSEEAEEARKEAEIKREEAKREADALKE